MIFTVNVYAMGPWPLSSNYNWPFPVAMGQELASNKLIRTCCSLLNVMSALAFNVILVSLW
jgi:hypothetical protein